MCCLFSSDIIRNSVGASEHDAVIFVGSGCTAAVHKLIQALALTQPPVGQTSNLVFSFHNGILTPCSQNKMIAIF